jgi:hypothetical protein
MYIRYSYRYFVEGEPRYVGKRIMGSENASGRFGKRELADSDEVLALGQF